MNLRDLKFGMEVQEMPVGIIANKILAGCVRCSLQELKLTISYRIGGGGNRLVLSGL